jgi:hypothetical protein
VKASVNLYTFRSERADPSGSRDGARAKGHKHSFKPLGTLTSIADLNKKQSAGGLWVTHHCMLSLSLALPLLWHGMEYLALLRLSLHSSIRV